MLTSYLPTGISFSTLPQPRFRDQSAEGKQRDPGNEGDLSSPKSATGRNKKISNDGDLFFQFCHKDERQTAPLESAAEINCL